MPSWAIFLSSPFLLAHNPPFSNLHHPYSHPNHFQSLKVHGGLVSSPFPILQYGNKVQTLENMSLHNMLQGNSHPFWNHSQQGKNWEPCNASSVLNNKQSKVNLHKHNFFWHNDLLLEFLKDIPQNKWQAIYDLCTLHDYGQ